jgi:hypothetical protein
MQVTAILILFSVLICLSLVYDVTKLTYPDDHTVLFPFSEKENLLLLANQTALKVA